MPLMLEQSQRPGRVERLGFGIRAKSARRREPCGALALPRELLAGRMGAGCDKRERNLSSTQGLGGDAQLLRVESASLSARSRTRARAHTHAPPPPHTHTYRHHGEGGGVTSELFEGDHLLVL